MAAESQLSPTQPVNQQVYRILCRDIVHCPIPLSTSLSEKEASVRFDVSRQPVHEASIKLAENGLIQIRPQCGSYVNKISLSRVHDSCFVHQAIECTMIHHAAGVINDEQVHQLEQNLHQRRIAVDRQQSNDFFLPDDEFHRKLLIIVDCQLAWDMMENIEVTIDRMRYMSLDHITSPEMFLHQHHEIFAAPEKHGVETVEQTMNVHLHEISESMLLIHQESRDWFSED